MAEVRFSSISRLVNATGSAELKGMAAEGACSVPDGMRPGVQENILNTVAKAESCHGGER